MFFGNRGRQNGFCTYPSSQTLGAEQACRPTSAYSMRCITYIYIRLSHKGLSGGGSDEFSVFDQKVKGQRASFLKIQ